MGTLDVSRGVVRRELARGVRGKCERMAPPSQSDDYVNMQEEFKVLKENGVSFYDTDITGAVIGRIRGEIEEIGGLYS